MSGTKPTAAIFVDVQNIYYTCRDAFHRQFNYRQLYKTLSADYNILLANAYAIASSNDGQHKFQTALKSIGFEVKLKPYLQRSDGSTKGDWDVGITIDILETSKHVEHVFLLSGDGDFDLLLQKMKSYGVITHVISVEQLTALALINSCDEYRPITADMLITSG